MNRDSAAVGDRDRGAPLVPLAGVQIALGLALVGAVIGGVIIGEPYDGGVLEAVVAAPLGRAEALLILVVGVLVSLLNRSRPGGLRPAALLRCGLGITVIGLLLSIALWSSLLLILGIVVALTPWLITARIRTLLVGSAVCFVLGAASIPAFGDSFLASSSQHGGLVGLLMQAVSLACFALYPLVVWAGFYFIGIVIGRLDLSSRTVALRMFGGGAVFAVLFSVALGAINSFVEQDDSTAYAAALRACQSKAVQQGLVVSPDGAIRWPGGAIVDTESLPAVCRPLSEGRPVSVSTFTSFDPLSSSSAWALQTTAIVIGALGLCLLISRSRLAWPLRALGSIALTGHVLYLAIVDDGWVFLTGTGGGHASRLGAVAQVGVLLAFVVVLLLIAVLIRRRWRRGPVEWLLGVRWDDGERPRPD